MTGEATATMLEDANSTDAAPADDFSAAFDKLSDLGSEPPADASGDVTALEEAAKTATPESAETEPAAAETAEQPETVAEEPVEQAEPAPEPAPQPQNDDILSRFAELMRQAQTQQQPEPPPQQQYAPEQPAPMFTPEEEKQLQEYQKDWPDVYKAELIQRRAEYKELAGYIFGQVAPYITQLEDNYRRLAERTHLSDLHTAVEDYDDIRDKVVQWAQNQPPYLRAAYNHVIEQGTVDEVSDLISRYRTETGARLAPATTPKKETELPPATKQAAASLAPVSSKRSAVPRAVDPQDFESAFASFAEKL